MGSAMVWTHTLEINYCFVKDFLLLVGLKIKIFLGGVTYIFILRMNICLVTKEKVRRMESEGSLAEMEVGVSDINNLPGTSQP